MPDIEDFRSKVARIAANEVGNTDMRKYWKSALDPRWKGPYPPQWCGAFALWTLQQALGCSLLWSVNPKEPGFLSWLPRRAKGKQPKIGDIVYRDKPFQHHAVVVGFVEQEGQELWAQTVAGNVGHPVHCVATDSGPLSMWDAVYSIDELIAEAIARGESA